MVKTLVLCVFLIVLVTINALPTPTSVYDKVNGNDPSINDVLGANGHKLNSSTHVSLPSNPVIDEKPEFKPKAVGTKFATLIDDIFQIPISILQSVAKLITHPFKHEPESSLVKE